MKKVCLSEEIFEVFLTKNLIVSRDPSKEQRTRFVRKTKTPFFTEPVIEI